MAIGSVWKRGKVHASALLLLSACAYVLPASWRAFRADPDDAAPAITRALDGQNLGIANWDQAHHKITTNWAQSATGTSRTRERFIVSWERDPKDDVLTVYVRHEAQDQEQEGSAMRWGSTYHSASRENELLDLIAKEFRGSRADLPRSGAVLWTSPA